MMGLGKYALRRILVSVPVLVLLLLFVFLLVHIAPGDPVALMFENDPRATQADIDRMRAAFGLDQPLSVQFGRFLGRVVTGDLGTSLHTREPVWRMITDRLPFTVSLGVTSLLFSVAFSLVLGVLAAIRRGTWIDDLCMVIALLGVSIPNFWLGLMSILLFSVILGWLPAGGAGTPAHLILPAIALGTTWAALSARLVRSSMLEVLNQDYVRTSRAKGLAEWMVNYKHALRNAVIPVVTYLGIQIPGIVGGSVVTETVFSRPGIGRLLVESISRRDLVVIEGVVLMIGVVVLISNLLVDLSYGLLDPRIRYD